MKGTGRRLDRVKAQVGPPPCQECRGWGAFATVCDDQGRCTRGEHCPSCGRVVPLRRVVVITGIDLDRV
jgi:DNA primase large subunit